MGAMRIIGVDSGSAVAMLHLVRRNDRLLVGVEEERRVFPVRLAELDVTWVNKQVRVQRIECGEAMGQQFVRCARFGLNCLCQYGRDVQFLVEVNGVQRLMPLGELVSGSSLRCEGDGFTFVRE